MSARRYLLLTALLWLPTGVSLAATVLLLRARNLDLQQIATVITAFSAVVIVVEMPAGSFADAMGRRRALTLAGIAQASGYALAAFARTEPQFVVALSMTAIGRALQSGTLESWFVDNAIGENIPRHLSRGWATESLAVAVGAAAGGLLPSVAPSSPPESAIVAFSVPMLVAAVLSLIALIPLLSMHEQRNSIGAAAVTLVAKTLVAGMRQAARDTTIRWLLLATFAIGFTEAALEYLTPTQLATQTGNDKTAGAVFGAMLTVSFVCAATGSALAPILSRLARSPTRASAVALLVAAGTTGGIGAAGSTAIVGILFSTTYLTIGMPGPLKNTVLHSRIQPGQRVTVLSAQSLFQQFGGVAAPLVTGTLAVHQGIPAGWLATAAVAAGGACCMFAAHRSSRNTGTGDP